MAHHPGVRRIGNGAITILAALMVVAFSAAVAAQTPGSPDPRDPRNAATWYRRAFERLALLSPDDRDTILNYAADSELRPPSPAEREILARVQPMLELAQRGSRAGGGDFGLDHSQGLALRMPHVQQLRTIARIMRGDAMARLHDGDGAAAADRLASLYRISDHFAGDNVLISSLVGSAIFSVADSGVQLGLDRAAFGPAEGAVLRDAVKSIDPNDPFGFATSIVGEREMLVGWMMDEFAGEVGLDRFRDEMAPWFDEIGGMDRDIALASMNEAQFQHALEQADAFIARVGELFASPDAEGARLELQEMLGELERGEHGVVAMMTMPAYMRAFDTMVRAREMLAARAQTLAALASGNVPAESLANAALLYLEAIGKLETLDPALRATLRRLAEAEAPGDLVAAADSLENAAEIMSLLEQASKRTRCDFSIADEPRPAILLRYAAGMRGLARLVQADAWHQLHCGDSATLRDRLLIACRMSIHLSTDRTIIAALAAHRIVEEAQRVIRKAVETDALTDEHRSEIQSSVRDISRRDPFGYAAALQAERRLIEQWTNLVVSELRGDGDAARSLLRGATPDEMLLMIVAAEAHRMPEADVAPLLILLDDVLDQGATERVRTRRSAVREAIAQGSFDVTADIGADSIAHVAERMQSARQLLHSVTKTLRAPE